MTLVWDHFTQPDGRRHRQIQVSEASDWPLFDQVAQLLQAELSGIWTAQLDGVEQRYWDLQVGTATITLHLEQYLGITVYAAGGADADAQSEELLDRAHAVLAARLHR